jgi:hypothetical protein
MIDPYHHHRATDEFPKWVENDFRRMFPGFSNNLVSNNNIVYQRNNKLSRYPGKTLMLVGAGPSCLQDSWKSIKFDFVWSMNQFYKSDVLKDIRVDLAMIMGETNLSDRELLQRAASDGTLLGFESHDRWLNHTFKNVEDYFCMHTNFYGKIGIGARMKIFAAEMEFKEVYFTGFDGPEQIFLGNHAFEPGKKTLPSVFDNQSEQAVSMHHKMQYDHLWDLIRSEYPQVKFSNLGGGQKYHEKSK